MRSRYSSLRIATVLVFVLTSCVSAEERLNSKFDTLPQVDSTLLYEYSAISSGATGECAGTFMHRWYGTTMDTEFIKKLYSDSFAKNGWSIRPEEVVEIWSIKGEDGLFRLGIDTFTDANDISKEQGDYRLPDSVLLEAITYPTIYLISMFYMYPSVAKKCFGI